MESENNINEKFKLRSLAAPDIFTLSRIISKIGVRNFKSCFNNSELRDKVAGLTTAGTTGDELKTKIGIEVALDVVDILFTHLPDCETELYKFLADVSGENVKKLSMADFMELLIEVIQKPEFSDFFKVASRLLK